MDIPASVQGVVDNVRAFGMNAALRDLEYRALNKVVPVRIFKGMTAILAQADATLFDPHGFEVRIAGAEELYAASAGRDWAEELPRAFLDKALAKGDQCVGIFDRERLVSIGWYAHSPTAILASLVLHFDPAWTYMYKGYSLPAYRGKHLHGIGMSFALKHYSERGARGLISLVEFNNLKSLRSVVRTGYRVFGDIYVVRLGAREIFWSTPGCRPYQFHVRRA